MSEIKEEWNEYLAMMKSQVNSWKSCETEVQKTKSCKICGGSGWRLFIGEDGNEYAQECECGLNERERERNKLRFANVPEMYRETKMKDIKASLYVKEDSKNAIKSILTSIKWWLDHLEDMEERGQGLYFWSKTKGCGKTMTAAALTNELSNTHKKKVKFSTSMQIINEIKASWDKEEGISESRLLKDLADVEYLVIDDFGTEQAKDWVAERFYQIINSRYIERRITIFTSNEVISELDYDERITNRILERCFKIHFPEESVRSYIAKINEQELERGKSK